MLYVWVQCRRSPAYISPSLHANPSVWTAGMHNSRIPLISQILQMSRRTANSQIFGIVQGPGVMFKLRSEFAWLRTFAATLRKFRVSMLSRLHEELIKESERSESPRRSFNSACHVPSTECQAAFQAFDIMLIMLFKEIGVLLVLSNTKVEIVRYSWCENVSMYTCTWLVGRFKRIFWNRGVNIIENGVQRRTIFPVVKQSCEQNSRKAVNADSTLYQFGCDSSLQDFSKNALCTSVCMSSGPNPTKSPVS